jgi:hypothetical protein
MTMAPKTIPAKVKQAVQDIVDRFNRDDLSESDMAYSARFRGKHVYLDRDDGGPRPGPICRLADTGDMNSWEFAIYKYSSDRYDPDECMFPGEELVDGTVEGALKAGMRAYPS